MEVTRETLARENENVSQMRPFWRLAHVSIEYCVLLTVTLTVNHYEQP